MLNVIHFTSETKNQAMIRSNADQELRSAKNLKSFT